jgi:organic radical activating enzyme
MTNPKIFKLKVLDTKSPSFCGAKWYNASIHLHAGWTTSCHHNPPHAINLEEVRNNPSALHNTPIKKEQRAMMQRGEKPLNCQFCWVMEETSPESVSDRVLFSEMSSLPRLDAAFNGDPNADYDLDYLEISFDRTCQLGCAYCSPAISSTWARDIRRAGPYKNLESDLRQTYISSCDDVSVYKFGDENPYAEAFFKWWETDLHKSLKILRITGGEPMMSGHTWKLLEWLRDNPKKSSCHIHMTTNLAYDSETLDRFLDICSQLDNHIEIWSSNESIGEKSEYVRDGISWQQWEENVDKVIQHPAISQFGICTTPSVPSIDGFVEFLEWALEKKKNLPSTLSPGRMMISVNPLRWPTFQNIVVLPDNLRSEYAKKLDTFLSESDFNNFFGDYTVNQLRRFSVYLNNVVDPHKESKISFEKNLQ